MTNSTHFNTKSIAWWRGKNLINLFEEDWREGKVLERKKMLDWRVNFHWKSFWWKSPTDRRQECNFSCFWQLTKVVTKNFPSTLNMIFASCIFVLETRRGSRKKRGSFLWKKSKNNWREKLEINWLKKSEDLRLGQIMQATRFQRQRNNFSRLCALERVDTCSGEELEQKSWTTGRNFN